MSLCILLVLSAQRAFSLNVPFSPSDLGGTQSSAAYSLPQFDPNPSQRAQAVASNHAGYLYGTSLIGNNSLFPTGPLGGKRVAADIQAFIQNAAPITMSIEKEAPAVEAAVTKAGGFKSLADYETLYTGQWAQSNPLGIAPGYFTNYTQDLHFSMERLSVNPFSTRRLRADDDLPFSVDDEVAMKIAGVTLASLHKSGRLFLASHSYQTKYKLQTGRYAAACDAYFYIHPKSNDFLPLAIKTNVGADLTYTPLDTPTDWLFAKMMFNSNDFFQSQIFHLANSHAVAEIVYLAGLRTLSERHPVRAFMDRIMYQSFAVRPVGNQTLFNPGGFFDQTAAVSNTAVLSFVDEFYPTVAGRFRANYFRESLRSRGLLDCSYGPPLKSFPFAEDAGKLVDSIHRFVSSFIYAYYPSPLHIRRDNELQAWIREANGPAQVLDFPPAPLLSHDTLIDILTQMAYLTGVNHHALNSNAPSYITGLLPFHPSSFFKPLPTVKGVTDITPYLADLEHAMYQVTLQLRFQRPQYPPEMGELVDMFGAGSPFGSGGAAGNGTGLPGGGNGTAVAGTMPKKVQDAAKRFRDEMQSIGEWVEGKKFDENGLSQGMPFLWKVLDPRVIPFFLSV